MDLHLFFRWCRVPAKVVPAEDARSDWFDVHNAGPVPKHTRRIVFVENLSFGCVPGHVIYSPPNSNGGSVSEQTFSSLHC